MFPHSFHTSKLPAPGTTVNAYIPHCDFLTKVCDETRKIGEVVEIGDEEGVSEGHVGKVVGKGGGEDGTEETV